MTTPEIRVHVRHIRALGLCLIPGVRDWCAANEIDFRRLIKEGIPLSEAETVDDDFAKRVVQKAIEDQ